MGFILRKSNLINIAGTILLLLLLPVGVVVKL